MAFAKTPLACHGDIMSYGETPVAVTLTISIVLYKPELALLEQTLHSLNRAIGWAKRHKLLRSAALFLVDNSPVMMLQLQSMLGRADLFSDIDQWEVLAEHGNIGYGAGHNRIIERSDSDFHLILNPDVILEKYSLLNGLRFMLNHPDTGMLAPSVTDGQGAPQYLCKRYPSVFDLLLRGFAPAFIKTRFRKRLDHYEMRDVIDHHIVPDIPIISGCFMLVRRSILSRVKGFAPVYFLYFEDFDFSLRIARIARIVYVPDVRIVHFGGHTARKGWHHILLFMRSAIIFFNRHGWKWF
jgi:GT2 family glycosyltransferase